MFIWIGIWTEVEASDVFVYNKVNGLITFYETGGWLKTVLHFDDSVYTLFSTLELEFSILL